jgi:hypothetical protein
MKPISRQRRWQIARQKAGLCAQCGKPATLGYMCATCRDKQRAYMLARSRRKAGIPLDAPLKKTGRPRIEAKE